MDVDNFIKNINNDWDNLDFKLSNDKDEVLLSSYLYIERYDKDSVLHIRVNSEGTIKVFFVFENIDFSFAVLSLINDFNNENTMFTASIVNNEEDIKKYFLKIYSVLENSIDEIDTLNFVKLCLNKFICEKNQNAILSILKLTR